MALRDQLLIPSVWTAVNTGEWSDRDRDDLADVALGVPDAASAHFLLARLEAGATRGGLRERFVHHVARYGSPGSEASLVRFVAGTDATHPNAQAALLKAVQQGLQERGAAPSDATRGLALQVTGKLLDAGRANEIQTGIALASAYKLHETQEALKSLGNKPRTDEATRKAALAALNALAPQEATAVLAHILTDASEPATLREQAAALLGASARPEADQALVAALPGAPERLQSAIALALAPREASARVLLDALAVGKGSPRVLQEPRVRFTLEQSRLADLSSRIEGLLKGLPPSDQKLRAVINQRRDRYTRNHTSIDPLKGAAVFERNCVACHQLQGRGARVGPQLDGINAQGADRLVEDILDPNRNVDQAFRTTRLALKDGRLVSGLLLREEGQVLVLADAQGKEVRVPREEVDEQSTAPISPMPANFADQISADEFDQLLTYLLTPR